MANNERLVSNLLTDAMYDDVNTLDHKSCWLWKGALNEQGYGIAKRMVEGKSYGSLIHRVSWYLLYGKIKEGMVIDHTCHDPSICSSGVKCEHRRCFNPYHLQSITIVENIKRGASTRGNVGMCRNNLHKWEDGSFIVYPSGKKMCISCQKEQRQRKKEKVNNNE